MKKSLLAAVVLTFLCVTAGIFLVKSIFLIICLTASCKSTVSHHAKFQGQKDQCHRSCLTKDCVITSNRIEEFMDRTVNPCDDFYQYACGNYMKQKYPMDGKSSSMLMVLSEQVQNTVSFMLRTVPDDPFKQLKTYHNHCVDFVSSEVSYVTGIRKILSKVGLDGWPNLFPNSSTDNIASRFLALGQYSFIKIRSFKRHYLQNKAEDIFDMTLDFHPIILSPSVYLQPDESGNTKKDIYRKFIEYVLHIFDFKGEIHQIVDEVIQLETSLAILLQQANVIDENDQEPRKPIAHEPYLAKDSKWANFLKLYLQVLDLNIDINRTRLVRTNRQLIESIKTQLESIPRRVIANYLALRLIRDNLGYASFAMVEGVSDEMLKSDDFDIEIDNKRNRAHFCNDLVIKDLLLEASAAYAEKYLDQSSVMRLLDIYSALENETINFIMETPMYDDFLKEILVEYLSRLQTPKTLYRNLCRKQHVRELTKIFHVEFTAEEFIGNAVERKAYIAKMKIRMALENIFFEPCQMVKPDFDAEAVANIITIGSGMIRLPMFSSRRPLAIDIGTLGAVLAHEMGHIIEFEMQKSEKTEHTQKQVDKNNKCFIDQYSKIKWNFIDEEFKGNFTLNENMADNFVHPVSYKILEKHLAVQEGQQPGLVKMTMRHVYFLSSSQIFCEVMTAEGENAFYEHDNHAPGEFRVLHTLRNYAPFAQAFECPIGSPMNPRKKCIYRRDS